MRRSSENCIFFQNRFLGNKYFPKSYEFLNPFWISEKTSVAVIKTCILTVLEINSEEKCWLGKVLILIVFGHWAKTFCPDSNMFLARKLKFHCTCAEDHFWEHIFKERCYLHFFRSLCKKLSSARQNFSGGIVKAAFYDFRGTVWVYTFSEKIISSFLYEFCVKRSAVLTKVFLKVCENCIFCVHRNIFNEEISFCRIYKDMLFFRAMS